jgi:serine/threonine protein kinase
MINNLPENRDPAQPTLEKIHLIHAANSETQANIWLVIYNNQEYVLRDYSGKHRLFHRILCRWAISRELLAFKKLQGVSGIPQFIKSLSSDQYLIEYIPSTPLAKVSSGLDSSFFEKLKGIVREMHQRGVAHCDLRKTNILVSANQTPYIIDFTTACWNHPFIFRIIFNYCCYLDFRRIVKAKWKILPNELNDEERHYLMDRSILLSIGHFLRRKFYRLFRQDPRSAPKP